MGTTWQERAEQWRRFTSWESEQERTAARDFGRTLGWMADAYELARHSSPGWAQGIDHEHVRHLGRVRVALARLRLPA